VPRKTKRPFWEELNFVADTFKVQSDILQGQAVAGGNYLLQDTILVGDPQLAMQVGHMESVGTIKIQHYYCTSYRQTHPTLPPMRARPLLKYIVNH
jgi:hypothetical protein